MRHVRTLGICLVGILAVAAVSASTASAALPEFGGCEPTARGHGQYKDPGCTVKATGAAKKTEGDYEWYAGSGEYGWVYNREHGVGFASAETGLHITIGPTTFETAAGHAITCTGGGFQSYYGLAPQYSLDRGGAPPNEVEEVFLSFAGCHEVGGAEKGCKNATYGAEPDEISDETQYQLEQGFRGKLVYLAGKGTEHPVVGLAFTTFNKYLPESKTPEPLFTVECKGPLGTVQIGGSKAGKNEIISTIASDDVDVMTNTMTETFSQSAAGIQSPSAAEAGGERYLEEELFNFGGTFERTALTSSFTIEAEESEPIEIKAIK